MSKHVHNWQEVEVNKPKIHGTSLAAIIDFIATLRLALQAKRKELSGE
jgi:hypothetical protein